MADASDSKSDVGDNVWVQVPPPAPIEKAQLGVFFFFGSSPTTSTKEKTQLGVFFFIKILQCTVQIGNFVVQSIMQSYMAEFQCEVE